MVTYIKTLASVIGKIALGYIMPLIVLVVIGIVYAIAFIASGDTDSNAITGAVDNVWLQYCQLFLFIASAFAMYSWFERKKGWSLGLKQKNAGLFALQGLAAGIILMAISAVLIWAFGGISWETASWNQELVLSLLKGIALYVCVAVSEEIFSRGYVQGLLRYHYGSTPAILVSSILFAFLHSFNPGVFDSPFPILNIFFAGVIMALARELTGGLWWPIGLHMTWNFFQGYVFGFNVSGTEPVPSVLRATDNGPSWLSGAAFGAEGSAVATAILIIGTIAVYYFYRRKNVLSANHIAQ